MKDDNYTWKYTSCHQNKHTVQTRRWHCALQALICHFWQNFDALLWPPPIRSRDRSVSRYGDRATGWIILGSRTSRGKRFFFCLQQNVHTNSGDHNGYLRFTPRWMVPCATGIKGVHPQWPMTSRAAFVFTENEKHCLMTDTSEQTYWVTGKVNKQY